MVILFFSLKTTKLKLHLKFNFRDPNLIALIGVAIPLFVGGVFYRLMPVFERMIASDLPQGSISYLGYSNQFLGIFATITTSGIATTVFPRMAQAFSENDLNSLKNSFLMAMTTILVIVFPVAIIFFVFGIPIIQILLERGAFTHDITIAVYSTFVILLGAFIFQSLGSIVMRVLYLSKLTVIATIIGFIEIASYLFSGLWLCKFYSFKGLAIAQSFSTGLTFLISMLIIDKRLFNIYLPFRKTFLKITFSNLILLLFFSALNIFWSDVTSIYAITLKICTGLVIMYYILLALKVKEVLQIKNIINIKIANIINYKKSK